MKADYQINKSEMQLSRFLKDKASSVIHLKLRPQGDYKCISPSPINICEVEIQGNTYGFGGIGEDFYDEMVKLYDWNDKNKVAILN